jgi:hydroxysqualene synthase
VLCPPALRAPIAAIYWFARSADDIADEGEQDGVARLAELARYRADLRAVLLDPLAATGWPHVFGPLGHALQSHRLPAQLLHDLLDAFEQDARMSQARAWYVDRAQLLDYCGRSANPIGRLLLHLYGVLDATSLRQSDQICTALQLINFWQDLGQDAARGRFYLPLEDCARHGVSAAQIEARQHSPALAQLMVQQVIWARQTMLEGAPLAASLPGRIGWELRLVVQGGLRILDKIEALGFRTIEQRPKIRAWDALPMLWRALRM